MGLDDLNICCQMIDNLQIRKAGISLSVLRLDQIHPVVSGNKLFKLHYFLHPESGEQPPGVITFGGAYSNHLVATAYACSEKGIPSIGIVRGEMPSLLSPTLQHCQLHGMKLHFVPRQSYRNHLSDMDIQSFLQEHPNHAIVPEGGAGVAGALGASYIMKQQGMDKATHICTAVGTGTTLAGLSIAAYSAQTIIGIPVLKELTDIASNVVAMGGNPTQMDIWDDFHFGGYAKKTPELIAFMNSWYAATGIPTDFVYTAKMLFGVMKKIEQGYFPSGSHVIAVHTGGLQGNASLPEGSIIF